MNILTQAKNIVLVKRLEEIREYKQKNECNKEECYDKEKVIDLEPNREEFFYFEEEISSEMENFFKGNSDIENNELKRENYIDALKKKFNSSFQFFSVPEEKTEVYVKDILEELLYLWSSRFSERFMEVRVKLLEETVFLEKELIYYILYHMFRYVIYAGLAKNVIFISAERMKFNRNIMAIKFIVNGMMTNNVDVIWNNEYDMGFYTIKKIIDTQQRGIFLVRSGNDKSIVISLIISGIVKNEI